MSTETIFTLENLLAAAMLEFKIHWEHPDGVKEPRELGSRSDKAFLEEMQSGFARSAQDGAIIMREIMRNYSVARGVNRAKDKELAIGLLDLAETWPNTLRGRADALAEKAAQLKESGTTYHNLHSGLSKLIWFLKPDGWTMFDSYVFRALAPGTKGKSNAQKYYYKLDELDFTGVCNSIGEGLKLHNLGHLYPERVVDKSLWVLGNHKYYKLVFDVSKNTELDNQIRNSAAIAGEALQDSKFAKHLRECFAIQ